MPDEEGEELKITVEGGMLGTKVGNKFSPIVNFHIRFLHFIGDTDIGEFFLSYILYIFLYVKAENCSLETTF